MHYGFDVFGFCRCSLLMSSNCSTYCSRRAEEFYFCKQMHYSISCLPSFFILHFAFGYVKEEIVYTVFSLSSITCSCVADGEVSTGLSYLVQKNEMSVYKSVISILLFVFCGTEMTQRFNFCIIFKEIDQCLSSSWFVCCSECLFLTK